MQFLLVLVALIGLPYTLADSDADLTPCQRHRQNALSTNDARLIPECDENGDYAPRQCYKNKEGQEVCICTRRDGSLIGDDPTRHMKACQCPRSRDDILSKGRMVGRYVPQCEDDGTYRRTQCHGSVGYCWCVDEFGVKVEGSTIFDDC